MSKCYINGLGSVTVQDPLFDVFESQPQALQSLNKAQQPSYKELIAPAMSRRMAKGVKMSIYAADKALSEAGMDEIEAIVAGTGLGCIEDSEKFLDAIIENDEQFLTPTAFIQSTHNTVAAQIALRLGCKAYNFTYVNGASSFESALFDAFMQLKHFGKQNALVGGVDEIAPYTFSMFEMVGKVKPEDTEINFRQPVTGGIPLGEGAHFFALSGEKNENTYAEVCDVLLLNAFKEDEAATIQHFLHRHDLDMDTVDVVVLGVNGDVFLQPYYDKISALFPETAQAYYQHVSASYDTASAYGLRLAAEILRRQQYPEEVRYNNVKPRKLQNILLVNQGEHTDFSFVLLKVC